MLVFQRWWTNLEEYKQTESDMKKSKSEENCQRENPSWREKLSHGILNPQVSERRTASGWWLFRERLLGSSPQGI